MTRPEEVRSRLWGLGSLVTAELTAQESGGAMGITRFRAVRGERGPRHVHSLEDEVFLINSGDVTVVIGEETRRVRGAGALFMRRGIAHSYEVTSPTADFYVITTPGGFERFFLTAGLPVDLGESAPVGERWSVERTQEIAEQLGLGLTWAAGTVTTHNL